MECQGRCCKSAIAFNDSIPLTGNILTKMDGDSRGGAALSMCSITGVPIKFIGTSEKIDGLEVFDAKKMADRILGLETLYRWLKKLKMLLMRKKLLN